MITDPVQQFPEYWAAIGTRLLAEAKFQPAIGALAKAILLDPTDLRSTRRMVQAFRSLHDDAMMEKWMTRFEAIISTLNSNIEVAKASPLPRSLQRGRKDGGGGGVTSVNRNAHSNAIATNQRTSSRPIALLELNTCCTKLPTNSAPLTVRVLLCRDFDGV